ncbi:hypothetical protein ZWY2020_059979 [Hordeum vulgare]|nr:hypothetical protein ZWY2020_059979 [Hordeum vulgare]
MTALPRMSASLLCSTSRASYDGAGSASCVCPARHHHPCHHFSGLPPHPRSPAVVPAPAAPALVAPLRFAHIMPRVGSTRLGWFACVASTRPHTGFLPVPSSSSTSRHPGGTAPSGPAKSSSRLLQRARATPRARTMHHLARTWRPVPSSLMHAHVAACYANHRTKAPRAGAAYAHRSHGSTRAASTAVWPCSITSLRPPPTGQGWLRPTPAHTS